MKVPARSAALISTSPGRAVAGRPSRVKPTVGSAGAPGSASESPSPAATGVLPPVAVAARSVIRTAPILHVDEELVAEHGDGRVDRRRDRRSEDADRGLLGRPLQTRGDVVGDVEQETEVLLAPVPVLDAVEDAFE